MRREISPLHLYRLHYIYTNVIIYQVEKILRDAKSHSLPENIIKTLEAQTGNSTACVQLLICKMSPMIWGVQKTVQKQLQNKTHNETTGTGRSSESMLDTFLGTLPQKSAFINFGDHCEKRFPFCKLLKFSSPAK